MEPQSQEIGGYHGVLEDLGHEGNSFGGGAP